MAKPYRIKHKASGYFYQRYNGSNLGKKGKVYMNNQSPLTMCDNEKFIRIQIRHNTLAYKALKDMLTSKMQADKVDTKLPDVDALIKESTSDEYINKKIKDILGE